MEQEKWFTESRESEPKVNEVIVDFFRHGQSAYTNEGRDLTEKGEEQVRESAEKIVEGIDPEKEIVVLWSSPARRAQGSSEILKEVLDQRGIDIHKKSAISSMRNFDQKDKEYFTELFKEFEAQQSPFDVTYARDPRFQEKSDKFESQPEVRERAGRVFNAIDYLARHAKLENKKLHIIGASHFEFLNPVMEDIFGYKVEEGQGMRYGEGMRIFFDYDSVRKETKISAEFRGERKDNIIFDKGKRKFIVEK
ncbi:MAG: histidine phosphatase family protein [Candidatus Liptonbacteria bacterium]|nr:histidine phosphatase family protein [Candidatus Liptonbacteria bacterium]